MIPKRKIILILLLAITLTMMGCEKDEPELDYQDFPHIEDWQSIDTIEHSGIWLIYFYNTRCGACTTIKPEMLNFAHKQAGTIPMYFIPMSGTLGTPPHESIVFTPTVIIYENNQYIEHIFGVDQILTLLESLKSDSYQIPDIN